MNNEQHKKILVVDDEPSLLDLMRNFLTIDQHLYELLTTNNAQEAIEILKREDIALVVSDINMPGISGLDLLAIIRTRYPHIKIILITGYNTPKIQEEVDKSGSLYFLEKPFKFSHLRELIYQEITEKREGFGGTSERPD